MGASSLMRVVLDTNILFSALISPHGAPEAIYRAWRSGYFEVVTSHVQLDEFVGKGEVESSIPSGSTI